MPERYEPPDWWHHYHADSQSTDHLAGLSSPATLAPTWSWPNRELDPAESGPPVASFDGAALSPDQKSIYVTTSRDGLPNFYALDTGDGHEQWSVAPGELDGWANLSAALVDREGAIYVADRARAYRIDPPDEQASEPTVRWHSPHDHVSMSLGLTAWGEVFEVTIEGEVSVYDRNGTGEAEPLARTRLARHPTLPVPLGVGVMPDLQESPRLRKLAYGTEPDDPRTGCQLVGDGIGGDFVAPGHIVELWNRLRAQGFFSLEPTLTERFFDTAFGGTFVSNTPAIVMLSDGSDGHDAVARIFIATLGEHHPPVAPDDPARAKFTDEILAELFLADLQLDWQKKQALPKLKPTETAVGGRYALDPDPDTRCENLGAEASYLYPAFGAPSGEDPVLPSSLKDTGELSDAMAKWQAIERMRDDWHKLTRGYYTGYLQMVDFNRTQGTLTTLAPIAMPGPSGTSAAITPAEARADGVQLVVLAAGAGLYAYEVGTAQAPPSSPSWCFDAGLSVGGSPTVLPPEGLDYGEGGGAGLAVLAGFRGVTLVQDRPDADCDPESEECCQASCDGSPPSETMRRRCKVLYDANPLPFFEPPEGGGQSRAERYFGGEAVTLAVGTSVPEAGQDHFYVAFTEGPAHDLFFDKAGIGSWEDYFPLVNRYAVVRSRDGVITAELPIDEAPVCDSAIGKDGRVFAVHTSGLDQLKHALYPELFPTPRGGILGFAPAP